MYVTMEHLNQDLETTSSFSDTIDICYAAQPIIVTMKPAFLVGERHT